MKADEFLTELARLEQASRPLGFSAIVTASITAALIQAVADKRQMDCSHTQTSTWIHRSQSSREQVTSCNECGKWISRQPI